MEMAVTSNEFLGDILSNKQNARFMWVHLDSCNGGYVPQSSKIDLDRQKEEY